MTAIIIPAADVVSDAQNLLAALLFSIQNQGYLDHYRVIVCFDGCRDEFIQVINESFPFIDSVINTGNRLNFAGNANNGLRIANTHYGTDAIVVNQDCILPNRVHLDVLKYLARPDNVGIRVPNPVNSCPEPPVNLDHLLGLNAGQPQEPKVTDHLKLTGFCMYLSADLMKKIGYFDEYFKATFEDDDICARAILAGFSVQHVDINVHHYGSRCGSYGDERLGLNLVKFRNKWSIPNEITHGQFNEWIRDHHEWLDSMKEL